jgi:hypothetical protein
MIQPAAVSEAADVREVLPVKALRVQLVQALQPLAVQALRVLAVKLAAMRRDRLLRPGSAAKTKKAKKA